MNDAKTIGSNALVLDTAEENVTVMNAEESKLGKEVSLIEQRPKRLSSPLGRISRTLACS